MAGLIDDSLRGMSDATDAMSGAVQAQAQAQNYAQNVALHDEMRQTQLSYANMLHGMGGAPAAEPQQAPIVVNVKMQNPLDDEKRLHSEITPLPYLPSEPHGDDDFNGDILSGDALLGGIGQRLSGGFLGSPAVLIGPGSDAGEDR